MLDGQAKALAKKAKNIGKFQGSYQRFREANTCSLANSVHYVRFYRLLLEKFTSLFNSGQPGTLTFEGSIPSFDRTCHDCGEPEHIRKDSTHPRVIDSAQQQFRVVVPVRSSNNCQGHPQERREENKRGHGGKRNSNTGRGICSKAGKLPIMMIRLSVASSGKDRG